MSKIGRFRVWADSLGASNAASTKPTASTNGVAIPAGRDNETLHLMVTKANTAHFRLFGYDANVPAWFAVDEVVMSIGASLAAGITDANESQRVLGLTGFSRVHAQRLDANVSNGGLNTFWAFSEPG